MSFMRILSLVFGLLVLSQIQVLPVSAQSLSRTTHWSSSDPSRIAVNPTTGALTAVYPGTAIICETLPHQCFTVTVLKLTK